jgi:hypothetical protein
MISIIILRSLVLYYDFYYKTLISMVQVVGDNDEKSFIAPARTSTDRQRQTFLMIDYQKLAPQHSA